MILLISSVDTVGVGDILDVSVFGAEEYSDIKIYVPENCKPYIPLVGYLHVCGLTLEKLSDTLEKLLSPYYKLPVIVSYSEMIPPSIFVFGDVANVGNVRYVKGMRLSDVISKAGLTPSSDIRNIKLNGRIVDLTKENPPVFPGDRVEVPSKWWRPWKEALPLVINLATFLLLFYGTFIK